MTVLIGLATTPDGETLEACPTLLRLVPVRQVRLPRPALFAPSPVAAGSTYCRWDVRTLVSIAATLPEVAEAVAEREAERDADRAASEARRVRWRAAECSARIEASDPGPARD